jgi:hypothetical protein
MTITVEDIIRVAGVIGALGTIWGLVTRVITPIRKMLTEYRTALDEAQAKINEIAELNKEQAEQIAASIADRQLLTGTIKDILSFLLTTECTKAYAEGHRTLWHTKDLDRIHRRYHQYGLNGAGEDLWQHYLQLPFEDDIVAVEAANKKIQTADREYRAEYLKQFGDIAYDPDPRSYTNTASHELKHHVEGKTE